MPVRKIGKSYRSVWGFVSDPERNLSVKYESALERDLIRLMRFNSDVETYEEQPVKIYYVHDNKNLSYIPDLFVKFKVPLNQKPWLCEVKYRSEIRKKWLELKPKFKAGLRYARENGYQYHIFSEVEIRTDYLLNVDNLQDYKWLKPDKENEALIFTFLQDKSEATPRQLLDSLASDPMKRGQISSPLQHSIAHQKIHCNFNELLTIDAAGSSRRQKQTTKCF